VTARRAPDGAGPGSAERLLADWRVRCARRRAPWELASGAAAVELCGTVVSTLESGAVTGELSRAVRSWGATVTAAPAARAALQCLGEAATAHVFSEFGAFRPRGLDAVLEELAREAAIPARRRAYAGRADALTGCLDRHALEHDLVFDVHDALASDAELTVTVLEVSGPVDGRDHTDDVALLGLLATVRRTFGSRCTVYRCGRRSLALVAPGFSSGVVGQALLLATCGDGPAFAWGCADLRALGTTAAHAPDALVMVAESDLHRRRQDRARAEGRETRRRHLSVVGSVAAGAVVLAGALAALNASPGSEPASRVAEPAPPAAVAAPLPSSGVGPSVSPPQTPNTTEAPPAPAAPVSTPPAHETLLAVRAPVVTTPPTVPSPPTTLPPTTPPAPKPAPTSTPSATPSPTPPPAPSRPGHSGAAPGHSQNKGHN